MAHTIIKNSKDPCFLVSYIGQYSCERCCILRRFRTLSSRKFKDHVTTLTRVLEVQFVSDFPGTVEPHPLHLACAEGSESKPLL